MSTLRRGTHVRHRPAPNDTWSGICGSGVRRCKGSNGGGPGGHVVQRGGASNDEQAMPPALQIVAVSYTFEPSRLQCFALGKICLLKAVGSAKSTPSPVTSDGSRRDQNRIIVRAGEGTSGDASSRVCGLRACRDHIDTYGSFSRRKCKFCRAYVQLLQIPRAREWVGAWVRWCVGVCTSVQVVCWTRAG